MANQELVDALKSTLEDYRLSRGEKNALKALFKKNVHSDNDLAFLRSQVFEIARNELISPQSKEILEWLEDVVKLMVSPPETSKLSSHAVFSTQEDCAQYLQGIISSCRKSIDVCVFTITDDRITNALIDAHHRKIKIRIISDDEKAYDAGSDIRKLKNAGIELKTDRDPNHMHHKFAIFDGERLLNGSYNWTRSAATSNEENFVITNDSRLVREFTSHFERLWMLFD